MKDDQVDAYTYELVNQIAREPNWSSAPPLISQLKLKISSQSKLNHTKGDDSTSLKNTFQSQLQECLRCGIVSDMDRESMKGYITLLQTILGRFMSCKLILSSSSSSSSVSSIVPLDQYNKDFKNEGDRENDNDNGPMVDDWLVQMFLGHHDDKTNNKASLMDMLVKCIRHSIFESQEENCDDEIVTGKLIKKTNEEKKKLWMGGIEYMNQLYDKWSEEPYFGVVTQNELLKKFLLRLFKSCNVQTFYTKEQLMKAYRVWYWSLTLEDVSYVLSHEPTFQELDDESMESQLVYVPAYFYDGEAEIWTLELVRDAFLAKREQFKTIDDVWMNSIVTVALYTVLNNFETSPLVGQFSSYLFPVRGTIDDSFSSMIYLLMLYHGCSDKAIQNTHKADIQLAVTQGMEIDNVEIRMLCTVILEILHHVVFADMFESLKPCLRNVALTSTDSPTKRLLCNVLVRHAKVVFRKDTPVAHFMIPFIFGLASELSERLDLTFSLHLSRLLCQFTEYANIEADKLSLYVCSLTATLENREKVYLSNPNASSRNKVFETFRAISFVPETAMLIDADALCGFYRVIHRCLTAEDDTIRENSWVLYSRAIRNKSLDCMEEVHRNSPACNMSLFFYTFSLIIGGPVELGKLKAGRALLIQYYQEQTHEELEHFHNQMLPFYCEKLSEGLIRSTTVESKEEAFLSLGLLYCIAPDLIRNSDSFLMQAYLETFDEGEYFAKMIEDKPTDVACWLAYLELTLDVTSLYDQDNQVKFILKELYYTDVYQKNQQLLQPLVSRLWVGSSSAEIA